MVGLSTSSPCSCSSDPSPNPKPNHGRQRELARKHPWARLSVKPSPAAFGQGHSLNLALAALRASGAPFWLTPPLKA